MPAGSGIRLALRLAPEEGWHVYWRNPGDSGLAPSVKWEVPSGVRVDPLQWPFPERIPFGPLVNYGYKKETFLISKAEISPNLPPGRLLKFTARVSWVICREECIPGEGDVSTSVRITPPGISAVPSVWAPLIKRAQEDVPVRLTWIQPEAGIEGEDLVLKIRTSPETGLPSSVNFFPYQRGLLENGASQRVRAEGGSLEMRVSLSRTRRFSPELSGVLVAQNGWIPDGATRAVEIAAPIRNAARSLNQPVEHHVSGSDEGMGAENLLQGLILLASAFLGGIILNLMPCVFPVLSLKVLGLMQHADENHSTVRRQALLYALGVVSGFWVFSFILMAAKSAGASIGWGFQLQYPGFVLVLCFLLLLISLNLYGVFEVGSRVQALADKESRRWRLTGNFFNGLLATILATPCTAPFMGAATAAAVTQQALIGFLVFTMLGTGMALPYVIIAWWPSLSRFLPGPGEWMITFRQLFAFPLLATVLWLGMVFEKQAGIEAFWWLSAGLLTASIGAWLYGKCQHPSNSASERRIGALSALVLIGLGIFMAFPGSSDRITENGKTETHSGLEWEKFSPEKLREYQSQGRAVLLDFTAAWCITCKVNERLAFSSEKVQERMRSLNLALLRADWTSRDPEIAGEIAKFGRNGVPLNALYSSNSRKKPFIFPSLLTPGILLRGLDEESREQFGKR